MRKGVEIKLTDPEVAIVEAADPGLIMRGHEWIHVSSSYTGTQVVDDDAGRDCCWGQEEAGRWVGCVEVVGEAWLA